jgi:hypothetical protein
MPLEAVITCIGESLRDDLVNGLETLDPAVRNIAEQLLDALPRCSNDEPIGLRFEEQEQRQTGKRRRKRAPTAYNRHMSDCLKAGGDFASCVQEWRDMKARGAPSNGA